MKVITPLDMSSREFHYINDLRLFECLDKFYSINDRLGNPAIPSFHRTKMERFNNIRNWIKNRS